MNPLKTRNHAKGPEALIQDALIAYLKQRDWFVKVLHGNMYQSGLPDLYAVKRRYGQRFIEVKNPKKFKFTSAQWEDFPRLVAEGVGIWVLTAATDEEYEKLFQPPNLWVYMGGFHR